ncbi:MAG: hypothetical protein JNK11_13865 [Alphaproteobacteria bacterium]|nr:hypothetical protein [Alphaproteobacteria bacterium]
MRSKRSAVRSGLLAASLALLSVLGACSFGEERERLMCMREYRLLELNEKDCRNAGGQPVMARRDARPPPPPDASPKASVERVQLSPPSAAPGAATSRAPRKGAAPAGQTDESAESTGLAGRRTQRTQ